MVVVVGGLCRERVWLADPGAVQITMVLPGVDLPGKVAMVVWARRGLHIVVVVVVVPEAREAPVYPVVLVVLERSTILRGPMLRMQPGVMDRETVGGMVLMGPMMKVTAEKVGGDPDQRAALVEMGL